MHVRKCIVEFVCCASAIRLAVTFNRSNYGARLSKQTLTSHASVPIIYSPVYLSLSYSFHFSEASLSYFQLMIQNPTAVLMNQATKVNLNDFENARRLSIFTLAICANSKIWSVTLRRIASGSALATAS